MFGISTFPPGTCPFPTYWCQVCFLFVFVINQWSLKEILNTPINRAIKQTSCYIFIEQFHWNIPSLNGKKQRPNIALYTWTNTIPQRFFRTVCKYPSNINLARNGQDRRPENRKIPYPKLHFLKIPINSLALHCNTFTETITIHDIAHIHSAQTHLWISTKDSGRWFLLQ